MSVFDYICLAVIAFSTIICAAKGLRKIVFKLCAIALAVIVSKYLGEMLLDAVNITLTPAIGMFVVFLFFYIIFKLIFKIIEGKLADGVQSIVIDRLLGALVGLFVGTAIVFVFTEVIDIVGAVASIFDLDTEFFDAVDNTVIFRLIRNLN